MNKKLKEFAKEHKKDMLIGAGVCLSTFVVYSVGYAVGYKDSTRAISRGIDELWKAHPELEDVMWEWLKKIENERSRP